MGQYCHWTEGVEVGALVGTQGSTSAIQLPEASQLSPGLAMAQRPQLPCRGGVCVQGQGRMCSLPLLPAKFLLPLTKWRT